MQHADEHASFPETVAHTLLISLPWLLKSRVLRRILRQVQLIDASVGLKFGMLQLTAEVRWAKNMSHQMPDRNCSLLVCAPWCPDTVHQQNNCSKKNNNENDKRRSSSSSSSSSSSNNKNSHNREDDDDDDSQNPRSFGYCAQRQ